MANIKFLILTIALLFITFSAFTQQVADRKLVLVRMIDVYEKSHSGWLLAHGDSTMTLLDLESLKDQKSYHYREIATVNYFRGGSFGRGFFRGLGLSQIAVVNMIIPKENDGYLALEYAAYSILAGVPTSLIGGLVDVYSRVRITKVVNGDYHRFKASLGKLKRFEPGTFVEVYPTLHGSQSVKKVGLKSSLYEEATFRTRPKLHFQFLGYGNKASQFRSAVNGPSIPWREEPYESIFKVWGWGVGLSPTPRWEFEYHLESNASRFYGIETRSFSSFTSFRLKMTLHQLNAFYRFKVYDPIDRHGWQFGVGAGVSAIDANWRGVTYETLVSDNTPDAEFRRGFDAFSSSKILPGINAIAQAEYFLSTRLSFQVRMNAVLALSKVDGKTLIPVDEDGEATGLVLPKSDIFPHGVGMSFGMRWHMFDKH